MSNSSTPGQKYLIVVKAYSLLVKLAAAWQARVMSGQPQLDRYAKGSPEAFIGQGEIEALREELLWPVADQLWRHGDFWKESLPGESRSYTAVDKEDGKLSAAVIELECTSVSTSRGRRIERAITVQYDEPEPELTKPLLGIARRGACCRDERRNIKMNKKSAEAWSSNWYDFSTSPEAGLVTATHSFELRTARGGIMWDDDQVGWQPQTVQDILVQPAELAAMEDTLEADESRLTRVDREQILKAIALHGLIVIVTPMSGTWRWRD